MTLQPYEHFDGVTNFTDDQFNENLRYSLKEWMKWSFLQIGAYQNIDINQSSGLYGGHPSILRSVNSPNYTDGQVWEAFRGDWVWETGVEFTGVSPTVCSGVTVDDTFYETSSTSGAYSHYINFIDGQIIFSSAIDTTADVRTSYSYRLVNIVDIKTNWFTELMFNPDFNKGDFQEATGSYNLLAQARRYMPAIGIEIGDRPTPKPYQIGGGQIFYQLVNLYILTENEPTLNNILDILSYQNDKVIYILDKNLIKNDSNYPLDIDYRGMTVNSPLIYVDILPQYQWTKIKILNTKYQKFSDLLNNIYKANFQLTCEVIFENI